MGSDVAGARFGRHGGRLARSLRQLLLKPGGLAVALLVAFIGGRSSTRHARAPNVETAAIRDAAELERSLVNLEANLELGQSVITHQSELKRRHERVSALACSAAMGQHADERRLTAEKAKRAQSRALAHLAPDEDHDEDVGLDAAPETSGPLAARRPGTR